MSKKFEVFGKSFNEPRSISGLSGTPPSPIGGIPSGVFAIFAVLILSLSLASYLPEEEAPQSEMPLTEAQSTYLENILSDRSRSSATLATYDTCGFLEMDLKEHLKEEMRVTLGTGYHIGGWGLSFGEIALDGAMPEMAMEDGAVTMDSSPLTGSERTSSNSVEGVDYSGTNNQEQGVDEADFVKTDGSYIYLVNNG